ncbi:Rv0909 family putative TA system antitoxin [Cellulomonas fengjieae]|uniref:Antitoxin n=1 Tax=Cellulomonas fengjieae TaxID=2819978 RepID=A0ABS3SIP2_9CELL|nr:Rv0909 family putative TA system antitoxin [Cellulomonas fengjieae]MBO3084831.1 antitoxin [Cellulomonas fengjieae]MBO3103796.1 antitoxin [Cellulomonas fengjieae]QVI66854.1 antitoxin [Cellulomonas fengjieae]
MGIDDLKGKAAGAMDSDQAEKASDAGLDKAGDAASSKTGGSHDEKITKATTSADDHVGND